MAAMLSLSETTAAAPCPRPFNLAAYVLARAVDMPDKTALQILHPVRPQRWSYGELEQAVLGVAFGLGHLGLPPGAPIVLRIGNSIEFPLAFLGAIAAGFLPVATPAALTGPEITRLVRDLTPGLVIAGPDITLPDTATPILPVSGLMDMTRGPKAAFAMGDPERPGYMVYTSGTSGQPRAVVHAHRAVWARRMMWRDWIDLRESDRLLHAGAFNWTYTLGTGLFDPWAVGATALVPAPGTAPSELLGLLKQSMATLFAAAPGIYRNMLKSADTGPLPHLRHGLVAGEKLPDETRAVWQAATGTPLHEAYGLSECSTFVSSSPARPAPPGVTGYAQTGRVIAVLGPDDQPVARGMPGVLAIHRHDPGLFLGYHGAPDETASKFRGDWFCTGDVVTMARDGAITYHGRDDDMMNAGGFRVSPSEVETALGSCPDSGEVAVVELQFGPAKSIIAAFYTGLATPDTLSAHAERCLARYKQPRLYRHLERLPMTVNGKINRGVLRQEQEATPW